MTSFISTAVKILRSNDIRLFGARACVINNSHFRQFYQPFSAAPKEFPNKIASEKMLSQIFKFVDQNVQSYKDLLKEAVAIPSVSSDAKYRDDCVKMVHWMQNKLKEVGASTELRDVGYQTIDGKEIKLPPVLVGVLGNVSIICYSIIEGTYV